MATFKDRFNTLFDESELNQEDFGQLFGASKAQVYNWRNQRGEPDSEMLKSIAKKCNVSVDWLVGNGELRTPLAEVVLHIEKIKIEKAAELINEFQAFVSEKYRGVSYG